MTVTIGTWEIGFSQEPGEAPLPRYFVIPVSANDEGFRLIGRKRSRLNPNGITGTINWPFDLAGITGADLTTEIRGIGYSVIGEPRTRIPDISIPSIVPAKMVNEGDFIGAWTGTNGGEIVIADATPPTVPDGATILGYRLKIDESDLWSEFVADGDLPATLPIGPGVPWWQWGVADFTVDMRITCVIEGQDGEEIDGPWSNAVTVTLTNTNLYWLASDLTLTPLDDAPPAGRATLALAGGSSFAAPSPYQLRGFVRATETTADDIDWASLETTFPLSVGGSETVATGGAVGGTLYAGAVLRDTETGGFHYASAILTDTIPELDVEPDTTPIVVATNTTITGLDASNRALIGQQVTGDITGGAAGWANITERRNQFRVDGVLVGSPAVDAPVSYTPVAGDNRKNLSLRVQGVNTTPEPDAIVSQFSGARLVVYPEPTLTGVGIADQTYDADSGAKTIAAATVAAAFAGTIEEYVLDQGSGTINSATGEISIPNSADAATLAFSVTASNSGGSKTVGFTVFWQEVTGPTPFPSAIPGGAVTVAEIRDSTEAGGVAGKRKLTWNSSVTIPAGFTLHFDAGSDTTANWLPAYAQMTPGTPYTTVGTLAVGVTCRPRLGWRRLEDGAFQTAWEGPPFEILGLETTPPPPTGDWPAFPDDQYQQATSQGLTQYASGDGASSSAFFGLAQTVEAYESFRGRQAADSHTLAQIRHWFTGNRGPIAEGGFNEQMDLHALQTLVIARNTPRVWNALTAAERNKCDLIVQAVMIAGMYACSTKTAHVIDNQGQGASLLGKQVWWKGGQNFSVAHPAAAFLGAAYFGPTAAKNFADNLNVANFKAQLQSAGLTNAYATYNGLGTGGGRPTASAVQNSVANWVCAAPGFQGLTLLDIGQIPKILLDRVFFKTIMSGLGGTAGNGWIGPGHQGYGKITAGASGLPNKGTVGMIAELDGQDGGPPPGPRSALVPYGCWDTRVAIGPLLALAVAGFVNRNASGMSGSVAAANRGMIDFDYKSEQGYRNFEKGKGSVYTETTTGNKGGLTWCMRVGSGSPRKRGYTLGMWFDVLYPWLTA